MKAFHGSEELKQKYLSRVRAHRLADNIVQGTAWDNGKGCAVGCTLENYDHKSYETELGIPEWLAHLEDKIFEGLDSDLARSAGVTADSAARLARSCETFAARSAGRSASFAARSAARSAGRSAESAAWSACCERETFKKLSEKLIELLEVCDE